MSKQVCKDLTDACNKQFEKLYYHLKIRITDMLQCETLAETRQNSGKI